MMSFFFFLGGNCNRCLSCCGACEVPIEKSVDKNNAGLYRSFLVQDGKRPLMYALVFPDGDGPTEAKKLLRLLKKKCVNQKRQGMPFQRRRKHIRTTSNTPNPERKKTRSQKEKKIKEKNTEGKQKGCSSSNRESRINTNPKEKDCRMRRKQ